MIDVEPLIQSELAGLMPLPSGETADWEDVLRRAEIGRRFSIPRRGRLEVLFALALLLALLAAVPALSGVGYRNVVHWLAGKPSPDVVEGIRNLDRGAPSGMAPHPIVGKTGLVYARKTRFGHLRIWLTPTRGGHRFCKTFEVRGRGGAQTGGCFAATMQSPIEVSGSGGLGSEGFVGYLEGRVNPAITRLDLRYVNGASENVPLQNGFFAVAVDPRRTSRLTDHPHELIGYGRDSKIVATSSVDLFYRGLPGSIEAPPVAEVEKEQRAITAALGGGSSATLSLSPSRAGGLCDRVNIDGVTWSWTCTDSRTLGPPLRFDVVRPAIAHGTGVAMLMFGVVKYGMTLTLRYQDGANGEIPLSDQRFVVTLPRERWRRGHRLSEIDVASRGAVVYRVPMAVDDSSYSDKADPPPRPPMIQIQNPIDLPIVARLQLTGSHGERLGFFVRRQTPTHWFEVVTVDGKAVSGENLSWFPGGRDATIDVGWVPMRRPSFAVPHPLSLFLGNIREPAVAARVVYRDGSSERLDLATPSSAVGHGIHGWFVYELTDARRARHPLRFEALSGTGAMIGGSPVPNGA